MPRKEEAGIKTFYWLYYAKQGLPKIPPPLQPPSPSPILFRCPKNEKEIEAKKEERK
jgi:hypothetical protein